MTKSQLIANFLANKSVLIREGFEMTATAMTDKPAAVPMWKGKPDLYDKLDIDGVSLEARCMVRRWNAEDDERRGGAPTPPPPRRSDQWTEIPHSATPTAVAGGR